MFASAARSCARQRSPAWARGQADDRPRRRQPAGRLLQPDQAVRTEAAAKQGHRGHHRRRQGRRRHPGQPDPGLRHQAGRRDHLHPGRRHRGRRAGQGRQGGRHPGRRRRPQPAGRAGRHLHRHRQRRRRQDARRARRAR